MPNFYITFGQVYRDRSHPTSKNIHPDGYVRIEAETCTEARDKAFDLFGNRWFTAYTEEEFNFHYFPMGEIIL